MKKLILSIFTFCTLIACKNSSESNAQSAVESSAEPKVEKKWKGKSFNFITPEDWEITDEEALDEDTFFLAIEKTGFDSSGMITVTAFNDLYDLDDLINMNIEDLKNNSFISNLSTDPVVDNTFNDIISRSSNFKFNVMGIKHEGIIHTFMSDSRSYYVLKQGAIEDEKKNRQGFKVIEESFSIEQQKPKNTHN